jgi:hypothetical protein
MMTMRSGFATRASSACLGMTYSVRQLEDADVLLSTAARQRASSPRRGLLAEERRLRQQMDGG